MLRPWNSAIRFIAVAAIVGLTAAPAVAVTAPDDIAPNPALQPLFHRTQRSGFVLGSIQIPAIDLDETFRAGVDMSVIDQGVAQWAGTVGPGEDGNLVLAGHRSTHTKPFADLDRLRNGDIVYVTDGAGFSVMYKVADTSIVAPTDVWITYDSTRPILTMFACHPKGSSRYRIVVTADLVAGRRIG